MRHQREENPFSWKEIVHLVWHFIDTDRKKFVLLSVVLTIVYFNYLVPPFVLSRTVDFFTAYTPGSDLTPFYTLVAFLITTQIITTIIRQLTKGALARVAVNARYKTKVWGFDRLVELSLEWHQQENTGNKIQRILTGSKAVENMMRLLQNTILVAIVTFVGTAFTTSAANPFYLLFYIVYFLIMAGIELFYSKKINTLLDEFNKQQELASGTFVEGASNMLAIKALGAKDTLNKKVIEKESAAKDVTYKKIHLRNLKWITFNITSALLGAVYLFMTAHEVMSGAISAGTIIMYWSYFFNFSQRVTDTVESFDELLEIRSDISRMIPIFNATNFMHTGTEKFPTKWNKITLKNIYFSYASGTKAVEDLSLTINKGEKVGIAGHSGSGKSTIVKLLLGLYQIQKGSITYGKQNLYDISHEEITKNIAIVLQETELFNLSLRENITMMREVDAQLLLKAITVAQLDGIIQKLPHGLDTLIGEKGYALSGGERQRVGIARALCKDAKILLLDEATSALDSQTEQQVMDALYKELRKDKTLVVIAHRIGTLKGTDRIVVFEKGNIIEEGRYTELLKNSESTFAKMHEIQN